MPEKAAHTLGQGHKATSPGWYQDRWLDLVNKYPNIGQSDHKRPQDKNLPQGYRPHERTGRACVLEFEHGGAAPLRQDFNTAEAASSYFRGSKHPPSSRRLFILEGLDPRLVSIFGEQLDVDPRVFVRHDRTGFWESTHFCGNATQLPSPTSNAFTWDFWDLRRFEDNRLTFGARVAHDYRHIALFRGEQTRVDNVARVHRKASCWILRKPRDGWDVLLVVDPPIKALLFKRSARFIAEPIKAEFFQGGYPDFVPYRSLKEACKIPGPRRESLLDDLCYYWKTSYHLVDIGADPMATTIFLQKIIASHYMMLLDFLSARQNTLEWPLTRRNDLSSFDLKQVEQSWGELQLFSRRYVDDITFVETIMGILGTTQGSTARPATILSSGAEYLFIHKRMLRLESKCHAIIDAYSALAGLVVGHQSMQDTKRSISEAKSVKALTWLAACFIPLSFICGVFSMNDKYLPGEHLFWVYFAVALPLVAITLSTVVLFNRGYDESNQWSLQTWLDSWTNSKHPNSKVA